MRPLQLLLAGAVLLVMACGSAGTTGSTTGSGGHEGMPGMQAAGTATSSMSFDQMFIAGMIPHHQSAIEMAKLAQQKAEHQEIKGLATSIITAQERENTQMRQWYRQWYGTDTIPTMSPEMMSSMMPGMGMSGMAASSDLANAKPFDKAFIDAMIPHHESAIMMARQAQQRAEHPELKTLAAEIIESQQAEIDQMKAWRQQWYGASS